MRFDRERLVRNENERLDDRHDLADAARLFFLNIF
jgi:hypothetical protein